MKSKEIENILNNTLCFTHGGGLSGLYGVLATEVLSSNNALKNHGDSMFKFTAPEGNYSQEDNFLFFESMADRGRLSYSSFSEKTDRNRTGFTFLLIISADSLLEQVDLMGNSDGILMGRQDKNPLELNIKTLNAKLLIPDSYKEDVIKFCDNLRYLGKNPPDNMLVFKPMSEIEALLNQKAYSQEDLKLKQKKLCESVGINAASSDKKFGMGNYNVTTKTSEISTVMRSHPLETRQSNENVRNFTHGQDLLDHMKQRPTASNLQRNSMVLFLERMLNPLYEVVVKSTKGRPGILDVNLVPDDLAFVFNSLAHHHSSKDVLSSGERRISKSAVKDIETRLQKYAQQYPDIVNTMCEILKESAHRDISSSDCADIIAKHKPLDNWFLAIDRAHQPVLDQSKLKEIINLNKGREILLWKEGMKEWVNVQCLPEFRPIASKILSIREKSAPSTNQILKF